MKNDAATIVARVLLLKRFPAFADLSPAALTPLAERVTETSAATGEPVVRDDAEAGVHFVLEGEAEVRRLGIAVATVGAGEILGDVEALAAVPLSLMTARAVSPCRTLHLSRAALLAAQEDCFPLQRALLERIGAVDLGARRRLGWEVVCARRVADAAAMPMADPTELAHRVLSLRLTRELSGLSIRALGRLAVAAHVETHAAGAVLWRSGERADAAIQVVRGRLRCAPPDGAEFEVSGAILLGLSEVLAKQPRWCDAIAVTEVVVMYLDLEDILDELEDDGDVAAELIASLASDAAILEDRIARSQLSDGESE